MEESTQQPTTSSISIKWGTIIGLIGIIFFLILDFTGQAQNESLRYVSLIFSFIAIFLAHKEYKDLGDGFMTYGKGLGIGTLLSLIGSAINAIFTFVYVSFINPEFIEAIKEKSIMDMEKRGMSDSEIDQAMQFSEAFMSPTAISIFTVIGGVFVGFLLSLIVSIFTKNNNPEGSI